MHAVNPDPNDPASLASASLITLTATVTDGDNDTSTATANIGGAFTFLDDGPSIDAIATDNDAITVVTQDAETIGNAFDTATANFSGAFSIATSSYGADGAGTTAWAYALLIEVGSGSATTLTSNGATVYIHQVGATIIGSTSAADPNAFRNELAGVLREVGPRVRRLREDPELQDLMQDPQVVAMVQDGDTIGLLGHPRFRALVERAAAPAPPASN